MHPKLPFAPYFRSDEPKKFAKVHKVFGASNASKILNEVPEEQREDTVNTLVFEAETRLRDPVYGCIGEIASLQGKMVQLQHDLAIARARLAGCDAKPSPLLMAFDDQLNMVPFTDLPPPIYTGFAENFDQNSLDSDQSGLMNGYSQFPFP